MLVYAAIVPHPAGSIPGIGGPAVQEQIQKTIKAFSEIQQEIYAAKPDTIVVISPHASSRPDNLSIQQNKECQITFKQFGDLANYFSLQTNIGLSYRLIERLETTAPVIAHEESLLDYGSAVPLFHLVHNLQALSVACIGTASDVSLAHHFSYGQQLRKPLDTTNERIAIIASADLSHDKKGQQSDAGVAFDRNIIRLLEKNSIKELLALPADECLAVNECGLRPITLLLGILAEKNYQIKTKSYERGLGIGYLTATITLT
jgi:aromatic ring-opening dioxygenase LigB subunit